MRGAISKSGSNVSLAGGKRTTGGQGVHREVKSEGHAEKYRAVIEGESQDEPVGQRREQVELALGRRRRSHSPVEPRCVRTARYGRTMCDPGRPHPVSVWRQNKRPYKRRVKWEAKPDEESDRRIVPKAP
jgi:hypothetical protein